MELVIAEKPSVARDLARMLGATRRGDSCLEGDRYVVTWCVGHLVELDEPASYDPAWKAWRADTLPMLPPEFRLRASHGSIKQWKVVQSLLNDRRFSGVINACDAGREGELIFRWCYQLAGARLAVRRLWVSSLTDAAIRAGFSALQPGSRYDALADAARCRAESDWLVGLNATRAFTIRQRRNGAGALYSVGRVQTPTLAMVVGRERAIRAFVARDYWELHARFTPAKGVAFNGRWVHAQRSALDTLPLAEDIRRRCETHTEDRDPPTVEDVAVKRQRVPAPLLFDLTSLQRTANGRYGMSAQRTLDIAQALYETHKLITYPRTDSRHLSDDIHPALGEVFGALEAWEPVSAFAARAKERLPPKSPRVFNNAKVSDHHAIIPTSKAADASRLDRDTARVYELIARRFLGVFMPDAEFELTSMVVRVGAPDGQRVEAPAAPVESENDDSAEREDSEERFIKQLPPPPDRFVTQGRVRLVAGWQEVAFEERESKGLQAMPVLRVGETLQGAYTVESKRTQAPRRYTDASLLAAMESAGRSIDDDELRAAMRDGGLGTPATRASVLETLISRTYMERDGKALVATEMGEGLIEALPVDALRSPELTGQWESRLARMARGQESREAFMRDIKDFVRVAVTALKQAPQVAARAAVSTAARAVADNTPDHLQRRPHPPSAPVAQASARPVASRRVASRRVASPPSAPPRAAAKRVRAAPVRVAGAAVVGLKCPLCGAGEVMVGNRAWGCSRWREGCGFVVPFEREGRAVTDAGLRKAVRDASPKAKRVRARPKT